MNKPFSSLSTKGSLKDRWNSALRDPAYLAWMVLNVILFVYLATNP